MPQNEQAARGTAAGTPEDSAVRAAAEESLRTRFAESIRAPFLEAVRRYGLIEAGDRIAVCISGGKDSMLLAKLMQMLQPESPVPFEVRYLIMDPGYNPENRARVEANARLLGIPYDLFEAGIFDVANSQLKNPCFLCARMRRGHLYSRARDLGCGKIALGHHFDDVIDTTLMAMLWGGQLQAMPPKLRAANFPGMSLIRPLYLVREEAIEAWRDANGLKFIRCACRFTEATEDGGHDSKRMEAKRLLRSLREKEPQAEQRLFESLHHLRLDTFPAWKSGGETHSFDGRSGAGEAPDAFTT